MVQKIQSEFWVFFLYDGTMRGSLDKVIYDLGQVEKAAVELGLSLNHSKSEIICADSNTRRAMLDINPDLRPVDPQNATLLGSPFGDSACIDNAIKQKINSLFVLQDRLGLFQAHDRLCLLQHAFSAPKLLYLLWTALAFLLLSS